MFPILRKEPVPIESQTARFERRNRPHHGLTGIVLNIAAIVISTKSPGPFVASINHRICAAKTLFGNVFSRLESISLYALYWLLARHDWNPLKTFFFNAYGSLFHRDRWS